VDRLTGVMEYTQSRFNLSLTEISDITAGDREALRRVTQRECGTFVAEPLCPRQVQDEALTMATVGEIQILAGSDYPHKIGSIKLMLEAIRALPISDDDKAGALGGNAAKLLGV
jgi:predicted TIM-barrel fold metal-dependent hydrolase